MMLLGIIVLILFLLAGLGLAIWYFSDGDGE